MTLATGYDSLIRYCLDPGRLEAANVGVLRFSPKHCFLKARTTRNNRRAQRFFGKEGHDCQRLTSFKQGIEERLAVEGDKLRTLANLERFIAVRKMPSRDSLGERG